MKKNITFFFLTILFVSCAIQKRAIANETMISVNKEFAIFINDELFNKGNTTIADKYFVPEFAKEEKVFTQLIRKAFPDLIIKIEEQIGEGNHLAIRWTASGTQEGIFLGISPTGKKAVWKGSWFWTIENGKVVDGMSKGSWDALGLIKQLQSK